jgi:hypothetical protein
VTDETASPSARAADLAPLVDRFGEHDVGIGPGSGPVVERDGPRRRPAAARRARGGLGRAHQAVTRQVGGVREPGRLAANHAQPCAPVASGDQLLDPSVVVPAGGRPAVFDEHLREVAPVPECVVEGRLQDVVIDHGVPRARDAVRETPCLS